MEDHGWSVDLGGKRIELPPMPQMPRIPRIPRGGALLILGVAAAPCVEMCPGPPEPGPHLKIPFGVEQATKVPVKRQLKMEFGFRTSLAAAQTTYAPPSPQTSAEAQMLTGDLNVAVVEWIVQFRIKDPGAYLFRVRDVPETFRYMSEAAMRQVVGDHSVDEVLTIGREAIALETKAELQRLCELY